MGYLTTFTVYNDHADLIKREPLQFAEKVYEHIGTHEDISFGIVTERMIAPNMVYVQQSRHADDHTIYVHMGNCVVEVNPSSESFQKLLKNNPEFANKIIEYLDKQVKEVKKFSKS